MWLYLQPPMLLEANTGLSVTWLACVPTTLPQGVALELADLVARDSAHLGTGAVWLYDERYGKWIGSYAYGTGKWVPA